MIRRWPRSIVNNRLCCRGARSNERIIEFGKRARAPRTKESDLQRDPWTTIVNGKFFGGRWLGSGRARGEPRSSLGNSINSKSFVSANDRPTVKCSAGKILAINFGSLIYALSFVAGRESRITRPRSVVRLLPRRMCRHIPSIMPLPLVPTSEIPSNIPSNFVFRTASRGSSTESYAKLHSGA